MLIRPSIVLFLFILMIACDNNSGKKRELYSDEFKDYWHSGKAEVAVYTLQQSRYGEIRPGQAVLIFVAEDIHEKTHIKLDNPEDDWRKKESVLKLNFTKKFTTGIYPYSMMMSVFSPIYTEAPPLKITASVQEWCGHVFSQLNRRGGKYEINQYSYFESDGDQEFNVDIPDLIEDDIWNRIRLDYKSLPVGEITILPGVLNSRLRHTETEIKNAQSILIDDGDSLHYKISYPGSQTLEISFSKQFPHQILRWEEVFYGSRNDTLRTTATLSKSLHIDYWTKNKNEHHYLRDSLGLED